jgi:hypothetical protein
MGSIFSKTAAQIMAEHKHIELVEKLCHKFRVPLILGENKETRLQILALFNSFTNVPMHEDKITIYWLKRELITHIHIYNEYFPEKFIEPVDYVNYKSEKIRLAIYSLKTSISNKEHTKVTYNLDHLTQV